MHVLGIAGSLRADSYNQGLLRAARELAPEGVELAEHDLRGLPFYDGDLEAAGDPRTVTELKDAIRRADALVIATPEYNRGLPGGLKNAEVLVPEAHMRFDERGELVDVQTREEIADLLESLALVAGGVTLAA